MVLPDMLRGACLAQLPDTSMVPVTAFVAALSGGVVLRNVYDVRQPLPLGDPREGGRLLLQWCLTIGLTPLLFFALNFLCSIGWAPAPDKLGSWLRVCLGVYGVVLATRSLLRVQQAIYAREPALTPSIPEVDRRAPVEEVDALPPMLTLERSEPEPRIISTSNIPAFVVGALLMAIALVGWNTNSLCLLRLPG
jgi:hypothetical protein